MEQKLFEWLTAHGPIALFGLLALGIAGLPVPGETLLLISGVLVGQHRMHAWPTYIGAMSGSTLGITVSYWIGRGAGAPLIRKHGHRLRIETDDVEEVRRVFRRIGKWGLMFGYFVPGIRHLTALIAGAASLEFGLFAMFAYVGACLWCAVFITAGFYVGDRWQDIAARLQFHSGLLAVLIAVAGAAVFVVRRRRRAGRP